MKIFRMQRKCFFTGKSYTQFSQGVKWFYFCRCRFIPRGRKATCQDPIPVNVQISKKPYTKYVSVLLYQDKVFIKILIDNYFFFYLNFSHKLIHVCSMKFPIF